MLTLVLALLSFVFTWIVAVPAGIYSAMHPRSAVDYLLTVLGGQGAGTGVSGVRRCLSGAASRRESSRRDS